MVKLGFKSLLWAAAIACMAYGVDAQAQRSRVFQNDGYFLAADGEQASPSDAVEPTPMTGGATAPSASASCGCAAGAPSCGCESSNCGCNSGCQGPNSCPCGYELDCGTPWTLQQCDNCYGITFGGWVEAGITGNGDGFRTNNGNTPVAYNDKSNGGQLNQLWAFAERATDTGGCGWDYGFRFDYIFGTDARDTQAFGDDGWDNGWNSSSEYGSAIPQLYATVAYNDLTVKVGHFFTIIGYEVVPAPNNFFYSHSYTMLYAEPFTHTGALGEFAYNDRVTLYGGYVQGWDSGFENGNSADMFLGGISLDLSDDLTVTYATTIGDFGNGTANNNNVNQGHLYMHSFVVDWSINDKLTYIFQHDLGVNDSTGGNDTEWYGINQYLLYDINCCWQAGLRFEWFDDSDGARVIGGNAGDYYEVTAGLNYKPHSNLTLRPEVRYDWFDGNGNPYAGGSENELLTYGLDLIVTF